MPECSKCSASGVLLKVDVDGWCLDCNTEARYALTAERDKLLWGNQFDKTGSRKFKSTLK